MWKWITLAVILSALAGLAYIPVRMVIDYLRHGQKGSGG